MFMKQPLTLKVTFWQHLGGDMAGASPERSQTEALLIDVVGWLGRRMRLPRKFRFSGPVGAVALAALAGCSSLPDSGPSASDITAQQALSDQDQRYLVVDIAPATVEALRRRGYGSFSAEFGDRRVSSEPVIGVGDSVTVTIWEAASGGLFSAPVIADRVSTGSNSATIPEQVVGRDGGITVPYAGRVRVAGRTTRAVQDQIELALEGKAIQPQVLVNVVKTAGDSVSVGGEVAAGARVPLSVKGDRLLDVLASAGGVRAPINETFVELSRGSRTSRIPLITIVNNPHENIYLHPGDDLTLVRDPQKFIAYGATGQNAEIPFDADGICSQKLWRNRAACRTIAPIRAASSSSAMNSSRSRVSSIRRARSCGRAA